MPDAIDNLAIDLNQANTVDEFPGYPGLKTGDLVPNMAGVRVGDLFYGYDSYGQEAPYNWRTGVFEYVAPPTPPADTDSQFGSYLAGIKDLQAPVSRPASSPNQPYTPTFTPMAAPTAVRVYPPATSTEPVSPFEKYLMDLENLQPPVGFTPGSYQGPSTPSFTPTAAPTAVRVSSPASLSNPSTLGGGSEIDYNIPDDPTIRVNVGNTDEQDARVYTPRNQEQYIKGNDVLVSPYQAGGTVGVQYLDPSEVAATTAGQKPLVPQGVVTRGETGLIPGKGLPNYEVIGRMDDGSVIYADPKNTRDSFVVPSVPGYPGVVDLSNLPEVVSNVGGGSFRNRNRELSTPMVPFQETATPVESYEPTAASVGGFDNTGGNVTAGPGGVKDITPDWKEDAKPKPGDEFKDSPWKIFDPTGKDDKLADYTSPTGEVFPTDQNGYKWNYKTQQFDCVGGKCSEKNPVEDTPKPPVVTTPPGGGTKPPTGGGQPPDGGIPGGGLSGGGTPGRGPTPLPPREPVTPLVRKETVIPTKGTKEVPLPDRQADPFAKLYADLLANSQQQQDQYRYINYDPDQIMNAAMSGFRRRGAMRSLQGY
jgi:hypothetical protein